MYFGFFTFSNSDKNTDDVLDGSFTNGNGKSYCFPIFNIGFPNIGKSFSAKFKLMLTICTIILQKYYLYLKYKWIFLFYNKLTVYMTRFFWERLSSCQINIYYTNNYKSHIFYYQTSCFIIPRSPKNHEFLENLWHFYF